MPPRILLDLADAAHGDELWISDGTNAGTALLADLVSGTDGSFPGNFQQVGNYLLLTALGPAVTIGDSDTVLWSISGNTGAQTQLLTVPFADQFGDLNWVGDTGTGKAIFWANETFNAPLTDTSSPGKFTPPTYTADLFATDGTVAGTTLLTHFSYSQVGNFALVGDGVSQGNLVYFIGFDVAHGAELWQTDGTAAGTVLARDVNPGSGNGGIDTYGSLVALGGTVLYLSLIGSTTVLGRLDTGTVATISTDSAVGPAGFAGVVNGMALFATYNTTTFGGQIWSTNGSASGTHLLADLGAGNSVSTPLDGEINGHKLIVVSNGSSEDLWSTDGNSAAMIAHLYDYPTTGAVYYTDLTSSLALDGKLYFAVNTGTTSALWSTDGTSTGTAQAVVVVPDGGLQVSNVITQGDHMLFTVADANGSGPVADAGLGGLWRSDGTQAGTMHIGPATLTDGNDMALLPGALVSHDTNGDSRAGLTFLSADGATVYDWVLNGSNVTDATPLAGPGAGWHIKGVVDINGDGRSDLIWQSDAGDVYGWSMAGAKLQTALHLGQSGTTWSIIGTGDFNGDGLGDVLFHNATDAFYWVWQLNGGAITTQGGFASPGSAWSVAAVADFGGDGKSDILWQNTNGQLYMWEMNGTAIKSQGNVGAPLEIGWSVAGTGDFNADGKADILFRNTDGSLWIWQMNGQAILAQGGPGNPGAAWHVAQVGDFNGDGKADILAQHDNGDLWVLTMNGTAATGGGDLGPVSPTAWHLA